LVSLNSPSHNPGRGVMFPGRPPAPPRRGVGAVRKVTPLPLIVKLTPNVTDILTIARAAVEAGADILSLVNTFLAIAVDAARTELGLANGVGGVSGPAIKPQALYLVRRVCREMKVP